MTDIRLMLTTPSALDYPQDPYWTGKTPDRFPRDPDELLDADDRDDIDDDREDEWYDEAG